MGALKPAGEQFSVTVGVDCPAVSFGFVTSCFQGICCRFLRMSRACFRPRTREARLAGFEFPLASGTRRGRLSRPVKRKQALLGSNLPRDSRIRRKNRSVAPGETIRRASFTSVDCPCHSFVCHTLKTPPDSSRFPNMSGYGCAASSPSAGFSVRPFFRVLCHRK